MALVPYIHFQGNCAEALAFYAEVFGAPPATLNRYSDVPEDAGGTKSDRIMHGELEIAGGKLMASDFPEGMEGDAQKAVSVMYPAPDAAEGQRIYDRLHAGGDTIMPYGPTFWSSGFGMVRDRFGTHWMISAPAPAG
jgi:PhnB protein